MPVEIEDSDLLNTVNTLLNDETGEEANPRLTMRSQRSGEGASEGAELTAINGCHRWVDREKDGRVKSKLVLKDFNRDQGRSQPEMFAPTPSTLSRKTMSAASSHDRNNHPERDYITLAIDVHTAFLHPDIDQELFAEPPEASEWYE